MNLTWTKDCNLSGNEAADSLAKEGTTKEQVDRSTSYPEVKTILKAKQHSKWRHKHPRYNKADPYYLLTRREQVTVFRLRTGHNRLNYHLYSKLRIGHTEQCPCGTGSQTTEHLLQFCPTYEPLRKGIWPDHTPLARKLYGSLRDLRCTATFIGETGISIWRTRRRRTKDVLTWGSCFNQGAIKTVWSLALPCVRFLLMFLFLGGCLCVPFFGPIFRQCLCSLLGMLCAQNGPHAQTPHTSSVHMLALTVCSCSTHHSRVSTRTQNCKIKTGGGKTVNEK